jgi:hypothetical protein
LDGRRNDVAQANAGGQNFCFLFGTTTPFDAETLTALYASHDKYVQQFTRAADALEQAGYFLAPEADAARLAARESPIVR